jgi:hypothetical protein
MPSVNATIATAQDQLLVSLERFQTPVVGAVRRAVTLIGGWLPEERPTGPIADRVPDMVALIDRSAGFARAHVDGNHRFAKRLIGNQRSFAKAVVRAVSPLVARAKAPARPARASGKAA